MHTRAELKYLTLALDKLPPVLERLEIRLRGRYVFKKPEPNELLAVLAPLEKGGEVIHPWKKA
jgi:hypothetical protein